MQQGFEFFLIKKMQKTRQLSKGVSNLQFMKVKEDEKIAKEKEEEEAKKKQSEHWTIPVPIKPRRCNIIVEETVSTTSIGRRKYGQQPQTKEEESKKRPFSEKEPSSSSNKKQKL